MGCFNCPFGHFSTGSYAEIGGMIITFEVSTDMEGWTGMKRGGSKCGRGVGPSEHVGVFDAMLVRRQGGECAMWQR